MRILIAANMPTGEALVAAQALARDLAALPQQCLRSDRRASLEQAGLSLEAALALETRLGLEVILGREIRDGVARFVSGDGRHGA